MVRPAWTNKGSYTFYVVLYAVTSLQFYCVGKFEHVAYLDVNTVAL